MKKTLFTVALFTFIFAVSSSAAPTTRYWDACKPSCGWNGNASGSPNGICTSCDIQGNKLSGEGGQSACQNGPAFTCMGQAPWAVDANMSYGFAAAHSNGDCGKCYELSFTNAGVSGKKMTIMVSNIGDIREGAAYDLMIPGGGVGDFDALTRQISQNGGSSSNMGARYGGFRAQCGANASCIRGMCDAAFGTAALADLKAGCYWYVDWFNMADNPNADARQVTCPQALIDAYKNGKGGGGGGPITPTTYTLTMSVNPNNSGTTNPASSQANISGGQAVNISATAGNGYTFANWTVTSGTATFANPNSANTTVTLSSNATIRANFTQSGGGATYTLTVTRNPDAGGTTNPSSQQSNIQSGTPVSISANPNNGYTFTNWTVTNGTATIANANSQSTTVSLTSNATVRANFTQSGGGGNYTLTVNRSPTNGGTTTPAQSQSNITAGQAVNISATASSGYTFTNWTVSSGTATFANAGSASTTVTLSSNATITANFTQSGTPPGGTAVNWAGTGTVKIEAENYVSNVGNNMVTSTANGITNIGYIENGYSTTYKLNLTGTAGTFPMDLRIATGMSNSNFTVWVNGSQVGSINKSNDNWDAYETVRLGSNVSLRQGENTIELRFQSAVNVDWLQFSAGNTSVRYNAAKASGARSIILRVGARSFTAALPAGHGYSSYKLVDLQGREIRSGNIGAGAVDLRFDNLKHSVQFLRLTGKGNTPLVLKAVTY